MRNRHAALSAIAMVLVAALMLASLPPAVQAAAPQAGPKGPPGPVYLPLVSGQTGAPAFAIVSPLPGSTVAGTVVFAVRPDQPGTVTQVSFKAGNKDLGADTTPADGFQVYIDAGQLPPGPTAFSATASGPNGSGSQSVQVTVQPKPPATTTVGTQGAVAATTIGSVITVPPGGAPPGTTLSVAEQSREQVTAETGLDWDTLNVTFLGGQQVTTDHALQKPLSLSSAGFGSRVQPGQAVVNYQILPDANGDGISELVAVNTAGVAPNQDVVSDPVAGIQLGAAQRAGKTQIAAAAGISGPPGTTFEIAASGLNPVSAHGNIATFRSQDGESVSLPAFVRFDKQSSLGQTAQVMIPQLPPGPATLTLRNESTSETSAPISVTIEALGPPSGDAAQIIDQAFAANLAGINQLVTLMGDQATPYMATFTAAISHTQEVRTLFQQLAAHPTAQQAKALDDLASMIENSNILSTLSAAAVQGLCDNLSQFGLIDGSIGALGGLIAGVGSSEAALVALGLTAASGGTVILAGVGLAGAAILAGVAPGSIAGATTRLPLPYVTRPLQEQAPAPPAWVRRRLQAAAAAAVSTAAIPAAVGVVAAAVKQCKRRR